MCLQPGWCGHVHSGMQMAATRAVITGPTVFFAVRRTWFLSTMRHDKPVSLCAANHTENARYAAYRVMVITGFKTGRGGSWLSLGPARLRGVLMAICRLRG
jgi:hypothetical protein